MNLVFEGGGIRGYAYLGVYKALCEYGIKVNHIVGTSAGSIFATLMCLGIDLDTMRQHCDVLIGSIPHDNIVQQSINICRDTGLHCNDEFYSILDTILEHRTFQELPKLTVVGTCITTGETVYFNKDTFPDMPIAKAVQISTAIPIYFMPVTWNSMQWCDGGLTRNLAVDYYGAETEVLGFKLHGDQVPWHPSNVIELIGRLEDIQIENNIAQSCEGHQCSIVRVPTGTISTLDFTLDEAGKQLLYNNGYSATVSYLNESAVKG